MNIIDRGTGEPIVVIPGVQGRWEWMKPGIDALARRGRVITFSLADEPSSAAHFTDAAGFSNYIEQVRNALEQSGLEKAAICGVSYGGLIAGAFAARFPGRASFFLRAPWLLSPLFCLASVRLYREFATARDTWWSGVGSACRAGLNALLHMFHPSRMARRVHLLSSMSGIEAELPRVKVPTLIVTGEESLEQVVSPRITREYLAIWPHARIETLARTGHLGIITRPDEFAALVSGFVSAHAARKSA
jgi:pimeloyl-ACP methyl ester carboxylesterase